MQSNKTITIIAALLILTILAAGCISTNPVQTETAAQGNQIDAKETPPKVEVPVEEAEPAPVETHWWDSKSGFEPGSYTTTMFGDIDAVKDMISDSQSYNLFDVETEAHILTHLEYDASQLNLERELQPAQYRQLVEEYGRPVHVTMETIDTDGGGMDKVAVRYEGGKGVWTEEFNYFKAASLKSYIQAHLDSNIYPELIIG
ncbi:MAG: hypothetical protein KAH86_02530 [Methanosarcinales archaeon]|nr:hypothetical protein [Methanosarcinales archaeon]